MDSGDLLSAAIAVFTGGVGAWAGYRGAMRSASKAAVATEETSRKANAAAWTTVALDLAHGLLQSPDQAQRDAGTAMLAQVSKALGDAEDAPARLRAATRLPEVQRALDQRRTLAQGDEPEYRYDDEEGGEQGG